MKITARQRRLSSSRRISELFETGTRRSDAWATLVGQPNDLPYSRIAYAVGKRHGSAVRRNRVRRRCREAFRLTLADLPTGWDWVLMPRVRDDLTLEGLKASLRQLTSRLERQRGRDPS
jgi:ribonuclease P protein component